jgi:hypothetical protein
VASSSPFRLVGETGRSSRIDTPKAAAWLYGFLAAVKGGGLYAPPPVVAVVEQVLARYEKKQRS